MDLSRELALEPGDEIEQLVRLIAAVVGVAVGAVDDLLEDEMPPRMVGEVGPFEDRLEIADVAVQIAGGEDFLHVRQGDDTALTAGRGPERLSGAAQGVKKLVGVRHSSDFLVSPA